MRRLHLILAMLVCVLFPGILPAQAELPPESASGASVELPQTPDSAPTSVAQAEKPRVRICRHAFYSSARRHPVTPREVSLREAVQSLGTDGHRFVRCELKDGSRFTGGIKSIQFAAFTISQGITGVRQINYSDLKEPPRPGAAVVAHFANGLKWTAVVAASIAVSPLVIPLLALIFTGVIND